MPSIPEEELSAVEFRQLMKRCPIERAKLAISLLDGSRRRITRLSAIRVQALEQLRAEGWTLQQIADELGVSRQQVHRLLKAV